MSRWIRNAGLVLMPALLLSVALLGCSGDKKKEGGKKGGEEGKKDGDGEPAAGEMKPVKVGKNVIAGVVKLGKEDPDYDKLEADLKKKIDAKPEYKTACKEAYNQTLWIVDKDTRGVKNVVVWLMPEKDGQFFDVEELAKKISSKDKEVVLDQPHCHFEPRVLVLFPDYIDPKKPEEDGAVNYVSTGQKFYAVNPASIPHNTKVQPPQGAGSAMSKVVPKSTKEKPTEGIDVSAATKIRPYDISKGPIKIACDIHPWMEGAAWAFPHPLATTTDKKGNFEIKHVPDSGKVRIFVWHEKAGFVNEGGNKGEVIDVSDAKKNFTINDVK